MSFYYKGKLLRKYKEYKNLRVRNFKTIDKLIRNILINEMESLVPNAYFFYINNNSRKDRLQNGNCLLETCLKKGLNELEVEFWLRKKTYNSEFAFAAALPEYIYYDKIIYRGHYYSEGWKPAYISHFIWKKDDN
ncbi:MAG: hypothetical protein AABX55_01445 [Nanoarchaeota archaeon]